MEVYVAAWASNDDHELIGIFTTEALARTATARYDETVRPGYGWMEIHKWQVDEYVFDGNRNREIVLDGSI